MSPIATSSRDRRARHCRTCHRPMQGHPTGRNNPCRPNTRLPRDSESLEDEDELETESEGGSESTISYASPPPTHQASPTPPTSRSHSSVVLVEELVSALPAPFTPRPAPYPQVIASQPSFVIPENGPFYRRNPNYVAPLPAVARIRLPDPKGSLVPTLIVGSDGEPVAPSIRSPSPAIQETLHHMEGGFSTLGSASEKCMFDHQGCSPSDHINYWPRNTPLGAGPANEYSTPECTPQNLAAIAPFVDVLAWRPSASIGLTRVLPLIAVWTPLFLVCFAANILGHYVTKKYLNW